MLFSNICSFGHGRHALSFVNMGSFMLYYALGISAMINLRKVILLELIWLTATQETIYGPPSKDKCSIEQRKII